MASPLPAGLDVVAVERAPADEVESLFEEERAAWRVRLGWACGASADSMARGVEWGIVRGAVLREGGRARALLVHQPAPTLTRLCGVVLPLGFEHAAEQLVSAALSSAPPGSRVEGQLAAFDSQRGLDTAFRRLGFAVEQREFLALDGPLAMRPHPRVPVRLDPLEQEDLAACATVLVAAHAGGIEARINEAFTAPAPALAYLRELVEGGGCGLVDPAASGVARRGGEVVGFCVASTTAPSCGHLPQVAVLPRAQGRGVGAALLERAVRTLREGGVERVTLSTSRANLRASAWYRRTGFRPLTAFAAFHRERPV